MSVLRQGLRAVVAARKPLIYVLLLVFVLYLLVPFIGILVEAFGQGWFGAQWLPQGLTLKWFNWAISVVNVGKVILNSFIIAGLCILISLVFGIPTAWAMAKRRLPIKSLLMGLVLLPRMIPPITFALGVSREYYALHLVDTYLGVALAHATLALPLVILIMSSAFEALDDRVLEAGSVCGANWPQTFWYLVVPLSMPGVMAAILFGFVTSFNEFTLTLMTYGPHTLTLTVQTYLSIGDGFVPVASALSVILLIPSLLILVLIQRQIKPENMLGGVKGV